ncbi:MAG: hypothetical protein ACJAXS_001996 [Colwellia sp.]|jgi:hypothetical protein
MLKLIVVVSLLFFCFISNAGDSPLKQIRVSNIEDILGVDHYRKLVLKAYTGIGYNVTFIAMPIAREIIEIKKGTIDAMIIKLSAIEPSDPDLIRVPVILATGEIFLYCQIGLLCNQSVMDEPSNLIGAITGHNFTTIYLDGRAASVYKTAQVNQLAKMLTTKRLNYILTLEVKGFGNISGLDKSKYNAVKLESIEAYHYIHRRIKRILPELTLSLQNVINENNKR